MSSSPRSARRAFSSGTQVVGPQSCSARPSSVSSRYDADHALVPEVVQVERLGHQLQPCQRSGSSQALTRGMSRFLNGLPV